MIKKIYRVVFQERESRVNKIGGRERERESMREGLLTLNSLASGDRMLICLPQRPPAE